LVYKPHFGTRILLLGLFEQLRAVSKKNQLFFEGGLFNFNGQKCFVAQNRLPLKFVKEREAL
jgi:hypothetical protein